MTTLVAGFLAALAVLVGVMLLRGSAAPPDHPDDDLDPLPTYLREREPEADLHDLAIRRADDEEADE